MAAVLEAGTEVYEPLNEFELSALTHALSTAMYKRWQRQSLSSRSCAATALSLPVPYPRHDRRVQARIYHFAGGEAFVTKPAGYRKIEGEFPTQTCG